MSLFLFFSNFFKEHILKKASCKTVFDHYFFDLKYYLQKNASIENISNLLNISPQKLDQISITNYSSSFQKLLNEYRYLHFLKELESPINSNLSFESIIQLCGFESNDDFIKYFEEKYKVLNKKC